MISFVGIESFAELAIEIMRFLDEILVEKVAGLGRTAHFLSVLNVGCIGRLLFIEGLYCFYQIRNYFGYFY